MTITRTRLTAPTIQKARVLDVDTRHYVCTIATEFTQKPLTWVTFMTPYLHHSNGEGIFFMPEVGSVCWVCEPSDGGMPFILGWCSVEDENSSHRAQRVDLNPGDIYLGTRDENRIILRRGGVIQIGATPLAQRFYLPVDNIIRDLCENYYLETLAGGLSWSLDLPENIPAGREGHRPGSFQLVAREFSDDPNPIAKLQIGSHTGDEATILSLNLHDSGGSGQKPRVALKISKAGKVAWELKKGASPAEAFWNVEGDFTVNAARDITLAADRNAVLFGKTMATVRGAAVTLEATSGAVAVSSGGGMTVTKSGGGPALTVGSGTAPVLLATQAFMTWLRTHVHLAAVPGGKTGPPDPATAMPPDVSIKSQHIKSS